MLLAAGYRSLTFQRLKEAVYLTARTSAMVCYLFIGSWTFSSVFSYLGGHEVIEHWVLAANLNATGFLILAQFIIFLLGWPLEWTEIIIIFVPIFLPLVKTFHIDPLFSASWSRSTSRPRSTRRRWPWRLTTSRAWRRRRSG